MLGIFFGLSEQVAQGTALVMVVPNVVVALWGYYRRASVDLRLAGALALGALPATFFGARLATVLPSTALRMAFAAFLIVIALDLIRRTLRVQPRRRAVAGAPWAVALGALGGAISGLFSIGGATVAVPTLVAFFGCTQVAAQGLGLAFALPSTLLSTFVYAQAGDVDWLSAIPLAAGGVLAVNAGVDVAHKLPERTLRLLFIGYLFIVSAGLFAKAHAGG